MRMLAFTLGWAALVGLVACGGGTGTTDTAALQTPITIGGCVSRSNDTLLLTPRTPQRNGAIGTGGTRADKYRLIDEGHTGIDRWVGRQVDVTGKVEQPRQEGAAPNATSASDEALSALPAIRVAQMTGGGDCEAAPR